MKTSYFGGLGRLDRERYQPISIARGNPRGIRAGTILRAPRLAPTWPMLKMERARYEPAFREILERLSPEAEWKALHDISNGLEPVLLCFEKPPFTATNWCHRRMVATWFENALGIVVDELELPPAPPGKPNRQPPPHDQFDIPF